MTGLAPTEGPLTFEALALATRNRGMPLEALRYDVTPAGLHHLLSHLDIPAVDPTAHQLEISGNVEERPDARTRVEPTAGSGTTRGSGWR